MASLDLARLPLNGLRLIEASAGTGKTYTIAGLYLRLLLERDLAVPEILVVTFTRAATEELRDRIRRRLGAELRRRVDEAEAVDEAGRGPLDTAEEEAIQRLRDAMQRMDEAAIFTIHSVCQRLLQEHAFDSGVLFDAELSGDESELLQQVCEDYWRRRFYPAGAAELTWAQQQWEGPAALQEWVEKLLARSHAELIPVLDQDRLAQQDQAALTALREGWVQGRDAVCELLRRDPGLSRAKNRYKLDHLDPAIACLDAFLAGEDWLLPQGFELFTRSYLAQSLKKGKRAPQHPLFELAEAFAASRRQRLTAARIEVLVEARDYAARELQRRKLQRRLLGYDDLLNHLDAALRGPGGERLAARIRRQYPVALMDEFQDTDPVQYAIFERIYGERADDVGLFMIGDPKQAIYSFRGADLFTYIHARRRTDPERDRFTLDTNWRSGTPMVAAVNGLFGACPAPFLYADDIPFVPVDAAGDADREPLLIDGRRPAALQWWFLSRGEQSSQSGNPKNPINKSWAEPAVAVACAAEIADLLDGGQRGTVTLGGRPLRGGDIAVLVRRHQEARQIREALAAVGVSSVYYANDSVYASDEAGQLLRVLAAIAEPAAPGRLGSALATDLVGASAADLDRLWPNEQAQDDYLQTFRELHQLWAGRGFMACFQALLQRFDSCRELLGRSSGERALTNLLQLAELLQVEALSHPGMEALTRRLQVLRERPDGNAEEQQLRLESDAGLVKIVTIHKSKGLEYPLVFVPFAWRGSPFKGGDMVAFHDVSAGGGDRFTLDLGSAQLAHHQALANRERLAEDLRLLYVAVTRARHWCRLSWGRVNGAEHSALAWLLHPGADAADSGDSAGVSGGGSGGVSGGVAAGAALDGLSDDQLRARLLALGDAAAIAVQDLPVPSASGARLGSRQTPAGLAARRFSAPIDSSWRVTSFSGLIAGKRQEGPDHDAEDRPGPPPEAASAEAGLADPGRAEAGVDEPASPSAVQEVDPIFRFPRGAGPGTFLHSVLEQLDFRTAGGDALQQMVARGLRGSGLGDEWRATVCETITAVLDTPLDAPQHAGSPLRLRDLAPAQCRVEMAFSYPLSGLAQGLTGTRPASSGPPLEPRSEQAPQRGVMNGFIDLVFEHQGCYYLADYKSNHLGDRVEDYDQSALAAAMSHHGYDLQALIYSVALHRYLAQRVPGYDYDRHFGGVWYLFLRGMRPGSDHGVHYSRPARERVERFDCAGAPTVG